MGWISTSGRTALALFCALALGLASSAYADDEPPVGDPPAGDPPGDTTPDGNASNGDTPVLDLGPAPDVRKRPPPPPPPGSAMPNWDLDHLNPDVGLPPPIPPPDPFVLRDIQFRHDNRTASADGRITPLRRLPQWIDVIERRDIEEWRPLDLGHLARRYPNVLIGDSGNPFLQIPNIRGMGGDRVKILTDGVWPGTQALGSQGGTLSLWDPESTERVEIYHGPGVYLKAIDSPGGLINVVPRRPRQHGAFSIDASANTSYNSATDGTRSRIEFDIGQERVAALVGITGTWHQNRHTDRGPFETSYDQFAADVAMDYFLSPTSRIGITAQYVDASSISSPLQTDTVNQPGYSRFFLAVSLTSFNVGSVFHGHRASVSIDTFLEDDDKATLAGTSGIGSEDDIERYDFHLEGNLYLHECHNTWAELSIGYAHLDRTETLLCVTGPGVPATAASEHTHVVINPSPTTRNADLSNCIPVVRQYEAEELLVSGLIEDHMHGAGYDLYGGLRFDYSYVDDNRVGKSESTFLVGGAVGIAAHLSQRHTAYANASLGWRRPNLYERHAIEVINGRTIFGDEDLDPEMHGNLEVGVKSSFRNRVSAQGAAFVHYTDEFIAPKSLAGGQEQILSNRGEVLQYGCELTGAWRPLTTIEGLELYASAGTTRSTNTSVIPNVPITYRGGTRYSVPAPRGYVVRRWHADLAIHGATTARRGNIGSGPYTTADFVVGGMFDLGRNNVGRINLGVLNIFNQDYRAPGSLLIVPGLSVFGSIGIDL